ncbi:ATP-binding cassette domain-containing protein [Streptomyces sp. NPDC005438]|uniref:ATP-binding cassette domain-containing protein n=1 Tax=Streptomyces sp. NPDC005438 TaxID=3156880 RepID=UPI00339DD9EB
MTAAMIEAHELTKRYGSVTALDRLSLSVERGTILGVLGPNGAGKTTTIDVLTTLLTPDEGHASVAGYDVVRSPHEVRALIGLTGQFAALDANLTARENLELFGRLLKLGRRTARQRAEDLLARFELTDAALRRTGTFSGGMRRRLDLAASLIGDPAVLFLDEPTTGLDPRSRSVLWEVVRGLRDEGMTILLTTQYLAEADELADRIVVVDRGRVAAEGTAEELKKRVGGSVCHLAVAEDRDRERIATALAPLGPVTTVDDGLTVPATHGSGTLIEVVRHLDAAEVTVDDLTLRRPTLDDVFFQLTGHGAEDQADRAGAAPGGGTA